MSQRGREGGRGGDQETLHCRWSKRPSLEAAPSPKASPPVSVRKNFLPPSRQALIADSIDDLDRTDPSDLEFMRNASRDRQG